MFLGNNSPLRVLLDAIKPQAKMRCKKGLSSEFIQITSFSLGEIIANDFFYVPFSPSGKLLQ